MSRYEIWNKKIWGTTNCQPNQTTATLDMAILLAKTLPWNESDVFFILDKNQSPSKVRGFIFKGQWLDAIDNCKGCANTGNNYSGNWYSQQTNICTTCKGASWRPF